jgi:hypothetical protein
MSVDLGWSQIPGDVVSMSNLLDDFFQWQNGISPPRGYEHYHPSAFGQCLRQMQYRRYAEKGMVPLGAVKVESRMLRLWEMGNSVHRRWMHYFDRMGVLRGVWQCTNPFCKIIGDDGKMITNVDNGYIQEISYKPLHEIDENGKAVYHTRTYGLEDRKGVFRPEKCLCGHKHFQYHEILVEDALLNFCGHADLILDFSRLNISGIKIKNCNLDELPKEPFVVDIKSINEYEYKNKVCKIGPHFKYQIQLVIYTNILDCPFGLLLYENKNDCSIRMFKIERSTETIFETIKRQAIRMNNMVEFNRLPPPRPFSKDEYECTNCPFTSICHVSAIWDDAELNQKRIRFYDNLLHV